MNIKIITGVLFVSLIATILYFKNKEERACSMKEMDCCKKGKVISKK